MISTVAITGLAVPVTFAGGQLHFQIGPETQSIDFVEFQLLAQTGRGGLNRHIVILNAALAAASTVAIDLSNGAAVATALNGQQFKGWF